MLKPDFLFSSLVPPVVASFLATLNFQGCLLDRSHLLLRLETYELIAMIFYFVTDLDPHVLRIHIVLNLPLALVLKSTLMMSPILL